MSPFLPRSTKILIVECERCYILRESRINPERLSFGVRVVLLVKITRSLIATDFGPRRNGTAFGKESYYTRQYEVLRDPHQRKMTKI